MARKFNLLPSLTNVVGGSTATLNVPVGVTYHAIHFEYSGVTLAQMKNIEVQINGKTIQEYVDGTRLQDMNKYYSRHTEAGILTLWFDRIEYDNIMLRRTTAIGTANVSTFQIKMDIDAAATTPVIKAFATVSPNRPLELITKVKRWVVSNSATGTKEVSDIPREGRIPTMFFFKSDINDCEVQINGVRIYELGKALGGKVQADHGRTPDDSKYTAIDFHLEGDPAQALAVQGVADFRLRPNFGTSGTADLVVEYLTTFNGI